MRFLVFLFCIALMPAPLLGQSQLCERAAQAASRLYNVPLDILFGITLIETGRTRESSLKPWPWALNVAGQGYWMQNKKAALERADQAISQGSLSFDIGCFQLNYLWHSENFSSLEQMIEPQLNANYAARFLSQLHAEFGNWDQAVAAYHSRTPDIGQRYLEKFNRISANIDLGTIGEQSAVEATPSLFQDAGLFAEKRDHQSVALNSLWDVN